MYKCIMAIALLLSTITSLAGDNINVRGIPLEIGESRISVIEKLGDPDIGNASGVILNYHFEGRNRLAVRFDKHQTVKDIYLVDSSGLSHADFKGYKIWLGIDNTMTLIKKLGNVCSEYEEDQFNISNYITEVRNGDHDQIAIQFRAQNPTVKGTSALMKKPVDELWLNPLLPKTDTNCNY